MARKRKTGARYASGRLKPARDPGNDRVRAFRAAFAAADGEPGDLFCAIGQAQAAGLLEGTRRAGRVLMEHGREWHRLHRFTFGGGVRTRRLERGDPAHEAAFVTSLDRRFRIWAAIVARLSSREQAMLRLVCVEHGDGWELPLFLDRLVNSWRGRHRLLLSVAGRPRRGDQASLEALKRALLALAEGGSPLRDRASATGRRI